MTQQQIAVTGATGFVAGHIIKQLLVNNFKVRSTVRSLASKKHEYLLKLPNAEKNLELFEADLGKEGSFDQVVQGCEIVIHTASPVFFAPKEDAVKELIEPAVNGTLNVLNSCARSKTVRRVVVTSSMAAVYDRSTLRKGKIYNEDDWNTVASATHNPYAFSKASAEKAAWEFVKNAHFDLVTLCPPVIIGPVLNDNTSQDSLNTSNQIVLSILKQAKKGEAISPQGWGFVHVDDVAEFHIKVALAGDEVSNKRFIIGEGSYSNPEITRKAIKLFPSDFDGIDPNNLKIDGQENEDLTPKMDISRALKVFPGYKLKSIETILIDTINNCKDLNLF
jgi:dihydroflavonol-4-reductase